MDTTKNSDESHINLIISNILRGENDLPLQVAKFFGPKEIENDFVKFASEEHLKDLFDVISLFNKTSEEEIILDSVQYAEWEFKKPETDLSHIYLSKNFLNDVYTINFLRTNISEISLLKISNEIALIGQALNGIYRRATAEIDEKSEVLIDIRDELDNGLHKLGKFYNWQISEERSLLRAGEKTGLSPMLTTLFMVKASIIQDEYLCMGTCNQVINSREDERISCECGGDYRLLSPYINLDQVSFVYPNSIQDISTSKSLDPKKIFQILEGIMIPKKLVILLNRLANALFGNKVILPITANFHSKATNDSIKLIVDYFWKTEDEIYLFAYVTDTRYSHIDLISAVSLPMIMREIKESVKNHLSFEDAIQKSKLKDWKQ
ncbi:MAG: hypothetical protein H7644_05720, partial [Candidatus Heimdallarchaeota archaeon]|nr:hypothetical protein [Candidatus Heimdallarchaeota archaeon]MCK5143245.1 hypothetical protein [Candidatus Heimdallarchaeota archaeon]